MTIIMKNCKERRPSFLEVTPSPSLEYDFEYDGDTEDTATDTGKTHTSTKTVAKSTTKRSRLRDIDEKTEDDYVPLSQLGTLPMVADSFSVRRQKASTRRRLLLRDKGKGIRVKEDVVTATVRSVYSRLVDARSEEWLIEDTRQCVSTVTLKEHFDAHWAIKRLLFAAYALIGLLLSVALDQTDGGHGDYWFIFVSHWALLANTSYLLTVAALHCHGFHRTLYRICRALIAVNCGLNVVVVFGYWIFLSRIKGRSMWNSFEIVHIHVFCPLLFYLDFLVSGYCPALWEVFYALAVCLLYVLWTAIHFALAIGNPQRGDGQRDEQYIYRLLNWDRHPLDAVANCAVATFVCCLSTALFFVAKWRILDRFGKHLKKYPFAKVKRQLAKENSVIVLR